MSIKWLGCPESNFRNGRTEAGTTHKVEGVVIHLSTSAFRSLINTEQNPVSHISSHYGVAHSGDIVQFVHETDTAYHCGLATSPAMIPQPNMERTLIAKYGSWDQYTWPKPYSGEIPLGYWRGLNLNLVTIGIENEGTELDLWTDEQYAANAAIVFAASKLWGFGINEETVIPHNDINRRHSCPGHRCDLGRIISLAQMHTNA